MPLLSRYLERPPRGAAHEEPARGARNLGADRERGGFLPTCANPRCKSGWLHLWRSRVVPVFEGGWCCSEACTAAQVEAALRREMDARGILREAHRHRIPLGLAMLEQGWITEGELRSALAAQRAARSGRLGGWLGAPRERKRGDGDARSGPAMGLPGAGDGISQPGRPHRTCAQTFRRRLWSAAVTRSRREDSLSGIRGSSRSVAGIGCGAHHWAPCGRRTGAGVNVQAGARAHAGSAISSYVTDRCCHRADAGGNVDQGPGKNPPGGSAAGAGARLPMASDVAAPTTRSGAGA
jgi:hypothetical protein